MVPPHSGALAPTSAGNPLRYRQQRSAGQDLLHPHRRVNRCLDQLCGVAHGVYHIYQARACEWSGGRGVATGGLTATFRGRNCCWCYCCCHCGDQDDPPQGKNRPLQGKGGPRQGRAGPAAGRQNLHFFHGKARRRPQTRPCEGPKRLRDRPERACNRPETGPKPQVRPSAGTGGTSPGWLSSPSPSSPPSPSTAGSPGRSAGAFPTGHPQVSGWPGTASRSSWPPAGRGCCGAGRASRRPAWPSGSPSSPWPPAACSTWPAAAPGSTPAWPRSAARAGSSARRWASRCAGRSPAGVPPPS